MPLRVTTPRYRDDLFGWRPRPPQVWIFEPGTLFLLGVFPTQLIRHKVKMLTNPTHNSRFPFKVALRESPTTYLAHKATRARVAVVARTTRRS